MLSWYRFDNKYRILQAIWSSELHGNSVLLSQFFVKRVLTLITGIFVTIKKEKNIYMVKTSGANCPNEKRE